MVKKYVKIITFVLVCALFFGGGFALVEADAATAFPSETNAFVDNYYIAETDTANPFFDKILPEIAKNIKENNKHSVTPYYDKLPVANNPENFQGLGSTTYANINGKTVTAEAFYRVSGDSLHDPNNGMGLLIYQCIQYKRLHPKEDVKITFSSYRTSVTASVCVIPESKYYGYMRSLYGTNYDEHGFVRISFMLTEAARMGIEVTMVNQLQSYAVTQYNPKTGKLQSRNHINFNTYFQKAINTKCYDAYAKGKTVSDFMDFVKVGWNVTDKTSDMQHVKSASVSHYLATDGSEHRSAVFFSSANLDENNYMGCNGNSWAQSGVIISDHDEIYRVTYNYMKLMSEYRAKEKLFEFRKLVNERNNKQIALIRSGKGNLIPADEQIVYLGTKNDPVFELYYTPFGGSADTWDPIANPVSKYADKLAESEDYVELIWNEYGYGKCYLGEIFERKLEKAFCENRNLNNKISMRVSDFDTNAIQQLALGSEIGYRSINSGNKIHSKDILMSYVENGVRHNVSLMTSCNFYMIAFNYRTNSMLVINETEKTGGEFYKIFGRKYSNGMIDPELTVSPLNLTLESGQKHKPLIDYKGKSAVTLSSSKTSVVKIENGSIVAVKPGSATVTVTAGSKKQKISVKVVDCVGCYSVGQGLTFNDSEQYSLSKQLKSMPLTFEASFKVDKSTLKSTTTIFGNDGFFDPCIVFSLNKSGNPVVGIKATGHISNQSNYVFNKVNAATGEKVHLSIVMDFSKKQMHCYINGKLAQTLNKIAAVTPFTGKYNYLIGGDFRNGNATYFTGSIYSVAVWSDMRTASEISNDYSKGITTSDSKLIAAYDLTKCSKHLKNDLSANKNNLEYLALWQDESDVPPLPNYEYSFAVIGDTQTMNERDPQAMEKIYDWLIANHKTKKIAYVMGMGDITNHSTDAEWTRAWSYISKLNGKIPYSLTRGNHDDWDDFNRNLHNGIYEKSIVGMMNAGTISLTDPNQPGVVKTVNADGSIKLTTGEKDTPKGGNVKGDITNSYRYLSIQGTDYIIITLDFGYNDKTIQWLDSILSAHPNHKAIITTHAYMYRDGTTLDAGDCYPQSYYSGYNNAQNGDQLWDKCLSKHKNVLLVLSGHDPWQQIAYRQDKGVNGNTVTQMLIDAQYVDLYGSTGMVAMLYFSDAGETLTVRYYSVEKVCYGSPLSQFTLNLKEHEHVGESKTTKATLTSNGLMSSFCDVCDQEITEAIYSPKTFKLSTTEYTYNGKERKPSVTVKDSKGNTLKENTDYTVSYESGRKNPGKYTVTITFKGNYEGTKKLTYTIKPKVTSKITATQTTKTITLKWNKVTGATGYRIYKYNSKTKKYEKLKDVTSTTLKLSNLKAGTTYKYKVRAYTKDEDTIFGENSAAFATSTKPATPKISKITSSKGKATVTWTNVAGESGYQVYYSTKKSSGYKKADSYKADKLKGSKSKLKSGKTYYFKVRAYKKTDSGTVYSAWSGVKSIKVK